MKTFDKEMRFDFNFCMEGYGKSTKEALLNALETAIYNLQNGDYDYAWEAIENDEVVLITEE